jgi:pyrrolidone-carboxylate peptidase
MRIIVALVVASSIACCHLADKPAPQPVSSEVHPTDTELLFAAIDLADVCLGIMDKSAAEVKQILKLLKHCRDVGVPAEESPESCGHYACNHIRMGKLYDVCPEPEHHGWWVDKMELIIKR